MVKGIYSYIVMCIAVLWCGHASAEQTTDKHFVFISASYNNAAWCERSLASVFDQDYGHWSMLYIDDCSTDGTGELVDRYVAERGMQNSVTVIHNAERMGHCYNQYHAIHSCPDDAIIIILDGDDWLAHNGVLTMLNEVYQDEVWITYGQFRYFKRGALGCSRQIPEDVLKNNSIRQYPSWITSHMRTFYAGLYKKIKPEDLMWGQGFLPMSVDAGAMFPMIEMAGRHSRFIKDVLYIYNDTNVQSFFHERAEMQREILAALRAYPPYEPLTVPPYQSALTRCVCSPCKMETFSIQDDSKTLAVVVPCHSVHAVHLQELLAHLELQTMTPSEVVISLSDVAHVSPHVLRQLKQSIWPFPVTVLLSQKVLYAGQNRNLACRYAHADVIVCQDADDIPHPQRLEIIGYFFNRYDPDFVMHTYEILKDGQEAIFKEYANPADIKWANPERFDGGAKNAIMNGNIAAKKEIFKKYAWPSSRRGQDVTFNRMLFTQLSNRILIYAPIYKYRAHLSSLNTPHPDAILGICQRSYRPFVDDRQGYAVTWVELDA